MRPLQLHPLGGVYTNQERVSHQCGILFSQESSVQGCLPHVAYGRGQRGLWNKSPLGLQVPVGLELPGPGGPWGLPLLPGRLGVP